ncbi:MAG: hypothetical protein JNL02_17050 [Saprospiraceae bacterium]|nr:hypothetical protein [Saprospiraceae bacterium]
MKNGAGGTLISCKVIPRRRGVALILTNGEKWLVNGGKYRLFNWTKDRMPRTGAFFNHSLEKQGA